MGTPALIKFMEEGTCEIFTALYRHMDGDPKVFGKVLKGILEPYTITEGRIVGEIGYTANGMGEMAAIFLFRATSATYPISIMHPESECPDGGFEYEVSMPVIGEKFGLKVTYEGVVLFDSHLDTFVPSKLNIPEDK